MINRLFVVEEEDGQDGDDDQKKERESLMTHKNQLLERVKKELLHRGQYQEVDQKCQSFKSFINLMETNRLFKELRTDPKKVTGDVARDIHKQFGANNSIYASASMHKASEQTEATRS